MAGERSGPAGLRPDVFCGGIAVSGLSLPFGPAYTAAAPAPGRVGNGDMAA